jgi:type II secretory pathway component PulK
MNFFSGVLSVVPLRWWIVLVVSALGIAAICTRVFETEKLRIKRAELQKERELRALTERISVYARDVHQRFPTGDVVVSERDLAERLRKRPEAVVTALNLLLNEQKVQRAPLSGYWKLNQ